MCAGGFLALQMLTLGSNCINDWQSIVRLNEYEQLRELRVSGNPVIVAGGSGSRYEVRPGLTILYVLLTFLMMISLSHLGTTADQNHTPVLACGPPHDLL